MGVRFWVRGDVDDEALSRLHAIAFGAAYELQPWRSGRARTA
jgi:hypothetical protein